MSVDKRSHNITNSSLLPNPGPYIARVVNNVDPMKQGSLEVELMRPIGNQKESGQQTFVVRYLSPFYGVTDIEHSGTDNFDFNHTQKSYGFWAVPPDTGCLVMVIFVDSDPGQGYWMGCVQDAVMNHMIPGIAASKSVDPQVRDSNEKEWKETKQTVEKYGTNFLPVGEVNRKVFKSGGSNAPTPNPDVEANKKPVHPLADVFLKQGLIKDVHRGPNTSSSRRESPSNVYGWSTPGPIDKRKNAQKGKVGRAEDKITKFVSRLGGHCIIMDDGNPNRLRKTPPWEGPPEYADLEAGETGGLPEWPEDEAFRIRTRTGHQIVLHNAEDFIYICNSRGTAWIELTSNGKIEFYAQDSISLRSEQDFNFHSDRDVNFTAARSVNFHGNSTYNFQSNNDINISSGTNVYISAGTNLNLKSDNITRISGDTDLDLYGKNIKMASGTTLDLSSGGTVHLTATSGNLETYAGGSTLITSGNALHALTGGEAVFYQNELSLKSTNTNKFDSGKATHILSGAEVNISAGAAINVTATGKLMTKGKEIHLNGDDPAKAEGGKTALQASKAISAGAADSGRANVVYPVSGVGGGGSIGKRAPGSEPYEHHENQNPPGHTPDLTDREKRDMPYSRNEERRYVTSTEDGQRLYSNPAGGGNEDSNGASKINPDRSAEPGRPSTDSQITSFPNDWTKDSPFLQKAQKLSSKYGLPLEHFLAVMHYETSHTMSPHITNSLGYTGLIQFGNAAARDIGTTTGELRRMSRAEQLDYVEKYIDLWKSRSKVSGNLTLEKFYMLVGFPAYANRGENEIIAGPNGPNAKVWDRNPGWREGTGPNKVGPITVKSLGSAPRNCISHVTAQLRGTGYTTGGSF